MALTLAQANAQLASVTTVDELRNLISQLDVTGQGSKTLLYSGMLSGGTKANDVALELAKHDADIRIVDHTEAAKFLNYADNLTLASKLEELFGLDYANVGSEGNKFLFGSYDASGTRITSDGAWDIVSKNFAQLAVGDVRVIAPNANLSGVFGTTELDAILHNPNVTAIEGIPKDQLLNLGGNEAIFDFLKKTSFQHMAFTGLHYDNNATNAAHDFLNEITDTQDYLAQHPKGNDRFKLVYDTLTADQKADYKAFAEMMDDSPHGLSAGGKVLNKLGVVGGLMGFALAYSEAASAAEAGDTEQAKAIMTQWAVDETGSAVGEALGTAVGGIAVAVLAAAGVAVSAPIAAAIVVGGSLVGGFFGGDGATGLFELLQDKNANDRLDILDKLADLLFGKSGSTELPADLDGGDLTFIPAFSHTEIVEHAKTDIAWRYALKQLNPFVVTDIAYEQHNTDGSLGMYDPATGQGVITEQWLNDRARFVVLVAEASQTFVPNLFLSWSYYEDIASDTQIGVPIGTDKYIFGGDNNDTIEGGFRDDHLYGGAGNDTLTGNGGNDYLEDGRGNDTYLLQTTGGIDKLLDHAGNDQLQINGQVVSGEFKPAVDGSQVYYSADKTYEWRLMIDDTWRLSVRTTSTGEYQAVADVESWQPGEFGITQGAATSEQRVALGFPSSPFYYHMNGSAATQGVQFDGGTRSDSFYGSGHNDVIDTGGGLSNYVINAYGGDDKVTGGDSKDFIRTGSNGSSTTISDNDYVEGGAQSDVLLGGYGSDQLWGDADNGAWLAEAADSGERGDWLGGENGNDSLYGSHGQRKPLATTRKNKGYGLTKLGHILCFLPTPPPSNHPRLLLIGGF